ncbi:MAG: ATP-binding cassette domain-containing protein [Bacteroidetes bacterium]|nr:ATP-binding cassette domain-containing protein [Bacteroidota bacterium]
MSIEVNGLRKLYGEQAAVDGISFSVRKGEVVGFLGPNGAGKSTTMKILTGYIPADGGKARVAGHDVQKDIQYVKRKTGYLPESNPLYHEMYVREYLDYIGGLNGIGNRKARISELLERTGLTGESNKLIGALSKGYKQRVGLAQAMMSDPEVLILDEPTSGLDPNQLVEIRKLIREIGQEKTVMLSTHIMQEVEHMCDRVLIINKGKIVADEDVETLSGQKDGSCLVEVRFEKRIADEALELIPLKIHNNTDYKQIVFSGGCVEEVSWAVYKYAEEADNAVVHLSKVSRNMESIFRELTMN